MHVCQFVGVVTLLARTPFQAMSQLGRHPGTIDGTELGSSIAVV